MFADYAGPEPERSDGEKETSGMRLKQDAGKRLLAARLDAPRKCRSPSSVAVTSPTPHELCLKYCIAC